MSSINTFRKLLSRIHSDEKGSVSLETILIVGAIALPVLIFTLKFGWPKVKEYFNSNLDNLDRESKKVIES